MKKSSLLLHDVRDENVIPKNKNFFIKKFLFHTSMLDRLSINIKMYRNDFFKGVPKYASSYLEFIFIISLYISKKMIYMKGIFIKITTNLREKL